MIPAAVSIFVMLCTYTRSANGGNGDYKSGAAANTNSHVP